MACVLCKEKFDLSTRLPIVGKCGHSACKMCLVLEDAVQSGEPSKMETGEVAPVSSKKKVAVACVDCSHCGSKAAFRDFEENEQIIELLEDLDNVGVVPSETSWSKAGWKPIRAITNSAMRFGNIRDILEETATTTLRSNSAITFQGLELIDASLELLEENGDAIDKAANGKEVIQKCRDVKERFDVFEGRFRRQVKENVKLLDKVADTYNELLSSLLEKQENSVDTDMDVNLD